MHGQSSMRNVKLLEGKNCTGSPACRMRKLAKSSSQIQKITGSPVCITQKPSSAQKDGQSSMKIWKIRFDMRPSVKRPWSNENRATFIFFAKFTLGGHVYIPPKWLTNLVKIFKTAFARGRQSFLKGLIWRPLAAKL